MKNEKKVKLYWYPCGCANGQLYNKNCKNKYPHTTSGHPIYEDYDNGNDLNITEKDKIKLEKYFKSKVGKNCWNVDDCSGFYICSDCSKYLGVAEDINESMNNHNMEIDFEYCLDSAYMLIDTYNSYKIIEGE